MILIGLKANSLSILRSNSPVVGLNLYSAQQYVDKSLKHYMYRVQGLVNEAYNQCDISTCKNIAVDVFLKRLSKSDAVFSTFSMRPKTLCEAYKMVSFAISCDRAVYY